MKHVEDEKTNKLLSAYKTEKQQVTKDNAAKKGNVNLAVGNLSKMVAKLKPLVPQDLKEKYGDFAVLASVEAHKQVLEEMRLSQGSASGKANYT